MVALITAFKPAHYWQPDDLYWTSTHATETADLHAEVDDADGEVWSSLCVQHEIGREVVVKMERADWLALATQCEQAVRYMDKLEGEINGR